MLRLGPVVEIMRVLNPRPRRGLYHLSEKDRNTKKETCLKRRLVNSSATLNTFRKKI